MKYTFLFGYDGNPSYKLIHKVISESDWKVALKKEIEARGGVEAPGLLCSSEEEAAARLLRSDLRCAAGAVTFTAHTQEEYEQKVTELVKRFK